MEVREIVGLDVGLKRTGVARASNVAKIAEPLVSLPTDDVWAALDKYLGDNKTEALVVGLPRNLKGEDTPQTDWVRDWVDKSKSRFGVPFYWQDEALTSVNAEGLKKVHSKADTDSISATIILQDFLDTPESARVVC